MVLKVDTKKYLVLILCVILFTCFQTEVSAQKNLSEEQKIELLITSVSQLNNAKFYRNGSYYDANTAASHLRMKRSKAGSKLKLRPISLILLGQNPT